ncbi:hypothetical protein CTI12_AA602610 [Artemisia annua]|uniref:CCHC-type domain-containing protein n=1 Tax=Artemisia annua TaxID=35608 RepID=A0A2U1KH44_ARTAN|nr:hypothetical protein CTI12_AA602610 [Artemisia annua]
MASSPNLCLVGKIFLDNRKLSREVVSSIVKSAWRYCSLTSVHQWENNHFLFTFSQERDLQKVLCDGPWFIKGHCLVLHPLDPNVHITEMDFTHADFWVQAHGLPFGKLTKSFATEIAPKVGTLIDVDCDVDGFQFDRSFLRFKVKVNLRRPLCPGFKLPREGYDDLWINFKYERLGDFCYNCGRLGHDVDSCGFECDSAISRVGVGLRTSRFISPPSSQRGHIPSQNATTQPHTHPSSSGNSSTDMQTPSPTQSPRTTVPLLCCDSTSTSVENSQSAHHILNNNLSGSSQVPINVHTNLSPAIQLQVNVPNNPQVPIYFVTEPAESPPQTPQRNQNELMLYEDLNIVEESLSRLSVKRKHENTAQSTSATKKQKKCQVSAQNPKNPVSVSPKQVTKKYIASRNKQKRSSIVENLDNVVDVPIDVISVNPSLSIAGVVAAPNQPQDPFGSASDKQGGSLYTSRSVEEFQSFLFASELFEIPYKGLSYTWDNKRDADANIRERIDRALCNDILLETFPYHTLIHHPLIGSDHAPLLYNTSPSVRRRKAFRFESMWTTDEACEDTIRKSWDDSTGSDHILVKVLAPLGYGIAFFMVVIFFFKELGGRSQVGKIYLFGRKSGFHTRKTFTSVIHVVRF